MIVKKQPMIEKDFEKLAENVSLLEVYIEMFKIRDFSFIVEGIASNSEGNWEKGKLARHEKQEEALKILTQNEYDMFLYGGAAGGAKGLSVNELVLTPFGFTEIQKLKVGATICATDGTVQEVIERHDNGVIPFYKLTFADGTTLDCDYSHIWLAWRNRDSRKIKNKPTCGEISARKYTTEFMYEDFIKTGRRYSIPLTEPVVFNVSGSLYGHGNFVKRDLDPYTLGVLLGDGCMTGKSISYYSPDIEIAEKIKTKYPNLNFYHAKDKPDNQGEYSFVGEDKIFIKNYLEQIGLLGKYSHEKFIPKIYLHGSIDERWELLRGLMDTDGYADTEGDSYYSTSSEKLRDDIMYLARSLGCFASYTTDENPYYKDKEGEKVYCKASYNVRIKSKTPENIFYLPRKKERVKDKVHQHYGNTIVNIEKIEPKKSICITVSNPNSLFITKNFIVTHNSFTGMSWIVFSALAYPNTRYFIARNELKDIRDSVMVTFSEVCDFFGIKDFHYNSIFNVLTFPNKSQINLIEVKYKPSDPEYKDVGSTLYTSGWFEEVGEINAKAVSVLTTRINRWNVDKYGLKGIVFLTGNPSKNWTKTEFYNKDKNGQLLIENEDPDNFKKKYLHCLVTENPFMSERYIDGLRKQAKNDKAIYERLFKGNWDYDDNPYQLAEQEMIEQIFDNDHVKGGRKYISADVARFGNDKARIGVFEGWNLIEVISLDISKTTDIELAIRTLRFKHKIPKNRVIIDDDGVGGGVTDGTGGVGFKNNGRVVRQGKDTPNYKNLQVQCLYLLADKINEGGLYISADITQKEKQEILEELAQIQSRGDHDPDRKLDCKKKGDIKNDIGRSPDWRDLLMMRCWFDLKRNNLELTSTWS